jgi:hypothetical protein
VLKCKRAKIRPDARIIAYLHALRATLNCTATIDRHIRAEHAWTVNVPTRGDARLVPDDYGSPAFCKQMHVIRDERARTERARL